MESRKTQAAEKKQSGKYNCTQSVLCTYPDITGMDAETAIHLTQAFAAGMGNMEGTCGSLVGAGLVLSMAAKDKAQAMQCMRRIMEQFQKRNGTTICRQLKGIDTQCPRRQCPDCVADAAEFLEKELENLNK